MPEIYKRFECECVHGEAIDVEKLEPAFFKEMNSLIDDNNAIQSFNTENQEKQEDMMTVVDLDAFRVFSDMHYAQKAVFRTLYADRQDDIFIGISNAVFHLKTPTYSWYILS